MLELGGNSDQQLALLLGDFLHKEVPITATMQLQVERVTASERSLSMPLAPNINDKSTAFGGSLAT